MFEFDQAAVDQLLNADDNFRRLYDKHRDLNAKVDLVNAGKAPMDPFELETMKREKLHIADRMQAMLYAHTHH